MIKWAALTFLLVTSCVESTNMRTNRPSEDEQTIPGYLSETTAAPGDERQIIKISNTEVDVPGKSAFSSKDARVRIVRLSDKFAEGRDQEIQDLVLGRVSDDIVLVSMYDGTPSNLLGSDALSEAFTVRSKITTSDNEGSLYALCITDPGTDQEKYFLADATADGDGGSLRLSAEEIFAEVSVLATQIIITFVRPASAPAQVVIGSPVSSKKSTGGSSSSTTTSSTSSTTGDGGTGGAESQDPGIDLQSSNTWLVGAEHSWSNWTQMQQVTALNLILLSDRSTALTLGTIGSGNGSFLAAVYDLATDSWRNISLGSNPGTDSPSDRTVELVLPLSGNRALMVGGGGFTFGQYFKDAWVLSELNGTPVATKLDDPPVGNGSVADGKCTFSLGPGREVFFAGMNGASNDNRGAILDTSTMTWIAVPGGTNPAGLEYVCDADSGMVYAISIESPPILKTLNTQATSPAWSSGMTTNMACCTHGDFARRATMVRNNKVYFAESRYWEDGTSALVRVRILDLVTKAWSKAEYLPSSEKRVGAPSAVAQGKYFYYMGGTLGGNSTPSDLLWRFNTDTNEWEELAVTPTPARRNHSVMISTGSRIMTLGSPGSPVFTKRPWFYRTPGE